MQGSSDHDIRDFTSLTAVTILIQGLTLISGPLIARMLGVHGRGEFAFMMAASFVAAQVTTGGIVTSIAQVTGKVGGPAWSLMRGNTLMWWPHITSGALASGLIAALALQDDLNVIAAGVSTLVLTIGTCAFSFALAMLNGEHRVAEINWMRIIAVSTYVGVVLILFLTEHPGPIAFVWLMVVTQGCGAAYALMRLRERHDSTTRPADGIELRRLSHDHSVTGSNAMVLGIDQLIVGFFLGTAALGLYAVAGTIANVTAIVLRSISDALLPRLVGQPAGSAQRLLMARSLKLTAAIALVMMCGLQLIAAPLLTLAFGSDFEPALPATRVLIVAWMLLAYRRPLQASLQAQGLGRSASAIEAGCTTLSVAMVAIGCAAGELTGAALGLLLGAACCVGMLILQLARQMISQ